jgi:hypothetical protein
LIWSDSQGASISSWGAEETAINPTVLSYVVSMFYNLQQNPRGTILTMLLTALPQSLPSKAMTRVNLPAVGA